MYWISTNTHNVNLLSTEYASDQELIKLLKKDDARALDQVFNRYWETLFRLAENVLLDENASKDIVQEIFINLWERRHQVTIDNLRAYLTQAVKYQVATYLRRGKFTDRHQEQLASLAFANQTEEIVHFNELEKNILDLLTNLPERCREVFYLSRFQGLNNREIAEQLNISIRTVETQISKALKFLRIKLKPSLLSFVLFLLSQ
mgnify:CR=1 FL=1